MLSSLSDPPVVDLVLLRGAARIGGGGGGGARVVSFDLVIDPGEERVHELAGLVLEEVRQLSRAVAAQHRERLVLLEQREDVLSEHRGVGVGDGRERRHDPRGQRVDHGRIAEGGWRGAHRERRPQNSDSVVAWLVNITIRSRTVVNTRACPRRPLALMPLARRTDLGDSAYAGLEDVCGDLQRCLADTLAGGLDFLSRPSRIRATAARPPRRRLPRPVRPGARAVRAPDLLLNPRSGRRGGGQDVAVIDADSPSAPYRADSEAALRQELGWAAHLSLHAVLLPPPRLGAANYARIVCQFLGALSHTALWVRVPLVDPAVEAAEAAAMESMDSDDARGSSQLAGAVGTVGTPESLASAVDACTRRRIHDPFEAWAFLRAACEGHPQLGVCLHVGASLPGDDALARWIGEPVRAIVVAEDAFTTNKRGFPVLPKRHQAFLQAMLQRNVQVVLRATGGDGEVVSSGVSGVSGSGGPREPTPAEAAARAEGRDGWNSTRRRWEYLVYLFRKIPDATEQELVEAGYRDYLSAAPALMDNLERPHTRPSKRTSKYACYEEAVLACLGDRVATRRGGWEGDGAHGGGRPAGPRPRPCGVRGAAGNEGVRGGEEPEPPSSRSSRWWRRRGGRT